MQEVSRKEAINSISEHPNVLVVFKSDNCPVCQKWIPEVLSVIEGRMPHLKMILVNSSKEENLFGPDVFPSTYAFKDGKRIDWIKGSAPLEPVHQKLLSLFGDKTNVINV